VKNVGQSGLFGDQAKIEESFVMILGDLDQTINMIGIKKILLGSKTNHY